MNLGIEDAFVFAHCAMDALQGDLNRLADYDSLRHDVHARVVARIDRLTRLARGRPAIVGMLRPFLMPAIIAFGQTRRAQKTLKHFIMPKAEEACTSVYVAQCDGAPSHMQGGSCC